MLNLPISSSMGRVWYWLGTYSQYLFHTGVIVTPILQPLAPPSLHVVSYPLQLRRLPRRSPGWFVRQNSPPERRAVPGESARWHPLRPPAWTRLQWTSGPPHRRPHRGIVGCRVGFVGGLLGGLVGGLVVGLLLFLLLLFLLVCSPEQTGWLSATSAWDFASASCPGSLFSRLLADCSCLFIFLFFLSLFLRASLACSDSGALSTLSLGPCLEATETPLQAESRLTRGGGGGGGG